MRGLGFIIISLVMLLEPCVAAQSIPVPADPIEAYGLGESANIQMHLNLARQARGIEGLHLDDKLTCSATLLSAYLAEMGGQCGHIGWSDTRGRQSYCGEHAGAGEGVACGYSTVEATIAALLKSPSHAKILLNPKAKRVGATQINKQWVIVLGY